MGPERRIFPEIVTEKGPERRIFPEEEGPRSERATPPPESQIGQIGRISPAMAVCARRRENIPALPASDWPVVRIYLRFLRMLGPS
eukprot:101995-Prorocentrum_minimum.AAC.1